jgi:hypothetical protein
MEILHHGEGSRSGLLARCYDNVKFAVLLIRAGKSPAPRALPGALPADADPPLANSKPFKKTVGRPWEKEWRPPWLR